MEQSPVRRYRRSYGQYGPYREHGNNRVYGSARYRSHGYDRSYGSDRIYRSTWYRSYR